MIHQQGCQRRTDHRTTAEAHHRQTTGQAAPVRKPAHQRRDRQHVAEPQPDPAYPAIAEQNYPELVPPDAEGGQNVTSRPAQRGDDARLTRPDPLDPTAEERSRPAEHKEEKAEHPTNLADLPITAGPYQGLPDTAAEGTNDRRGNTDRTRKGLEKYAETVGGADAEMDCQRARDSQPTIVIGPGDTALPGKPGRPDRSIWENVVSSHPNSTPTATSQQAR